MSAVRSLPSVLSEFLFVTHKTAIRRAVTNFALAYSWRCTNIPWCNDTIYPSNINNCLCLDIIKCVIKLQWAMSNKNSAPFAVLIQSLTHQHKLTNNTTCTRSEHQLHTQF